MVTVLDGSKARSKIRAELSDLNEKYTEAVKDYVKGKTFTRQITIILRNHNGRLRMFYSYRNSNNSMFNQLNNRL